MHCAPILFASSFLFVADQTLKHLALDFFPPYPGRGWGFFLVWDKKEIRGAVDGIALAVLGLALVLAGLSLAHSLGKRAAGHWQRQGLSLGLLTVGLGSNVLDLALHQGRVVNFVVFSAGNLRGAFNLADVTLVAGAVLAVFLFLWKEKNHE